jgi:NAD(P) transhydrogenase subunit beta
MIDIGYLFAAMAFIFALKLMNSPLTAKKGNRVAMIGMAVALGVTLFAPSIKPQNFIWIGIGLAIGFVGGYFPAKRVQMTAIPQMVALLNGLGGGAVALVALFEFLEANHLGHTGASVQSVTTVLSAIIGSISFAGSMIAFGKLQEILPGRPIGFKGQQGFNLALVIFIAALSLAMLAFGQTNVALFIALLAASLVLGLTAVMPIGGADMPVVISLLNSFTGCAAGLAGFVLNNNALLIGGGLVGASGFILTLQMCVAMNRSLANVLFSGMGSIVAATGDASKPQKQPKSYSPEDVAILLSNANSVVIVPGYGMAVAQAQHQAKELAGKLMAMGVDVKYAVHPVAGRMPGHMNVLLAEADVPYEQLYELEQINPLFPETDVVLVVGANDVVNPAARYDKTSPIYGMPILDVDKARTVIVSKRSMNPGFAGVENELFLNDNTVMVFGNAKTTIAKISTALDQY